MSFSHRRGEMLSPTWMKCAMTCTQGEAVHFEISANFFCDVRVFHKLLPELQLVAQIIGRFSPLSPSTTKQKEK